MEGVENWPYLENGERYGSHNANFACR